MSTRTPRAASRSRAVFATPGSSIYPIVVTTFVTLLLLSNIGATKGLQFGPLLSDGGVFLFPLTYVIADVLAEVYGLAAARRAILLGFAMSLLASLAFWLVAISPAAPGYTNQDSFEAVLGVVPQILTASVCGYLVGEFCNAYLLVRLKRITGERRLWARLVSSTVAGQFCDTLVFCLIAGPAIGITGVADLTNYILAGFGLKVGVEVVMLPVTYRVIAWVKRREPTYAAALEAIGESSAAVRSTDQARA